MHIGSHAHVYTLHSLSVWFMMHRFPRLVIKEHLHFSLNTNGRQGERTETSSSQEADKLIICISPRLGEISASNAFNWWWKGSFIFYDHSKGSAPLVGHLFSWCSHHVLQVSLLSVRTCVLQGGKQPQGATVLHSLSLSGLLNVLGPRALVSYLVSWARTASHVILSHMRSPDTRLEKLVDRRNIENQWPTWEKSKSWLLNP